MREILILGAGTGGTIMANRLRRRLRSEIRSNRTRITVVDQDDFHVYQPGLLLVPFGTYRAEDMVRGRRPLLHRDVNFIVSPVEELDVVRRRVRLRNDQSLHYDVLIIASGARLMPEETEGLKGDAWMRKIFDFYSLSGASALRDALADFTGGRLVINITDMPIKCPVAPLEFAFLADYYFRQRGLREKVDITYVTPLDGAFTKPKASAMLGGLLEAKNIHVETEFNTGEVDDGSITSWDERRVDFDLLVTVPLHGGRSFIADSDLGDDLDFVRVDPGTLQSDKHAEIFALGDATNLPTSKAGSVAHFQSEILTDNIMAFLNDQELRETFDGHSNCFIETGFGKAALIDFNYDTEPLPGLYPWPLVGPLPLLRESRLNHWGKLLFRPLYWKVLLPGRYLPVSTHMSHAGKKTSRLETLKEKSIN